MVVGPSYAKKSILTTYLFFNRYFDLNESMRRDSDYFHHLSYDYNAE